MSDRTSTDITYDRRGAGEPLILIHGIGSRWQVWEPVLDLLAERFEVIAIDLPGFGASPARGSALSVYRLADAVEQFCADLGIDRPHVAGNSMGGGIALELGKRGVVRSVTAFSPIGFWHTPGLLWCQGALRTMRTVGRAIRPALPLLARTAIGRTLLLGLFFGKPAKLDPATVVSDVDALIDAGAFDQALRSFAEYRLDGRGELGSIPVTVAWGNRDALLTYATQSRRARRELPDATHVTLAGAGHLPFSDDPAACAERAMAFWPNKGEPEPGPELGAEYRRINPVLPRKPVVPDSAPGALHLPLTAV